MKRMLNVTLAAILSSAASLPTVAGAEVVTIGFGGTITSAENIVFDDPDFPQSNFFQVGQRFTGSVTWETALPGDIDFDMAGTFPLTGYSIVIGGINFSERFLPRLIGRDLDGDVEFLAGGASQGGYTSLELNLGTFSPIYPMLEQLRSRTAAFRYEDYQPFGGIVSGTATFAGVPEPASWALMIGGFGLVGGMLRRATRTTVRFA